MKSNPVVRSLQPGTPGHFVSFEECYQALWSPMVRLAWLLSGSREVAEDLVHDVFLRLEPKWQELEDPAPYFRRSLVNAVSAHRRRAAVENRHATAVAPAVDDPEVEEIWGIVSELPERQRHALVLRFFLDFTIEQVADYLGCPTGTAKSLIHRGVASVRRRVRNEQ